MNTAADGLGGGRRPLWLSAVGVLAVLVAGALVWLLYGLLVRPDDADLPLVRAPAGAYKVRPQDPGGLEVSHRDTTAYDALVRGRPGAVPERITPLPEAPRGPAAPRPTDEPDADAQTDPGERADADAQAAPETPSGVMPPKPAPRRPAGRARPADVRLHFGAFPSREAAERAWRDLSRRHSGPIAGAARRITAAGSDRFRLQTRPLPRDEAERLCARVKADGGKCSLVR